MKKSLLFLSFCLIFCVFITNFQNKTNSNIIYAQSETKYISVIGRAEIEKQADYVELNFCIQNTSNSYNDTQTKINNMLENLEEQIKLVDENAQIIISNCNCKPIYSGTTSYKCICNFVIKSSCLDCVDKIIEVAGKNGISCFNGVHYTLENKQEILDELYNLANKDAENKALNISKDIKLVDSNNFKQLKIPFFSATENIRIEAKVKNLYELINDNYLETEKELNNEQKDNTTSNNDNNTEKNINLETNVDIIDTQPQTNLTDNNFEDKSNLSTANPESNTSFDVLENEDVR